MLLFFVQVVTTRGWTTESATQAYLFTDQQSTVHGRLPESCHMTRVAGTRLVLHVRNSLHKWHPKTAFWYTIYVYNFKKSDFTWPVKQGITTSAK